MQIYRNLSAHCLLDIGLFPVSDYYGRASVNIHEQVFCGTRCHFSWIIYLRVEGWSEGRFISTSSLKWEGDVPFPQMRCRVPGSSHPQQQLRFSVFFILVGVEEYLIVAFFSHDS